MECGGGGDGICIRSPTSFYFLRLALPIDTGPNMTYERLNQKHRYRMIPNSTKVTLTTLHTTFNATRVT
ncbi:hypothetical protein Hamer_G024711 [Homarus americanus]|uniref:Uncharacterized protein n=1 Tax=Homarus americanus TaxID=6706 RepID=A0A8J5N9N5_HOMAM|nr:hypothetical protein Hamer_G024711 [Homarus americanus]